MYSTTSGSDISLRKWVDSFIDACREYGFATAWDWHICCVTHGSGSVLLGMYPYDKKSAVIRYAIRPIYRVLLAMQDAKRWFECRFIHEHMQHIVRTDLSPGWYDKDTLILEACFKLLVDYVEKEHDGEQALAKFTAELADETKHGQQDGYYNPPELMLSQSASQSEILSLYRWWKIKRPADLKRRDDLLMSVYGDNPDPNGREERRAAHDALDSKIYDDEHKMLHRLIDVRRSMWT